MQRVFLLLGMWLVGIANAWAFDMETGEVLRYNVYWGPLKVGHAQLEYVPQGRFDDSRSYVLKAHVWDNTILLDMDDTWRATGVHTRKQAFMPVRFEALQKENDYRADKLLEFDAKAKTVTYTNRHDPSDTLEPMAWPTGMRDVLSALYAWRAEGVSALDDAASVTVITTKRPFVLKKQAAVRETITLRGEEVPVWRVDMTTQTDGHDDADSWIVRLRADASLQPVQIWARTKFGSFHAVLDNNP